MADVLFIAVLVAFFGMCVGLVRICDRVIGVDVASEVEHDLDALVDEALSA